MNQNYKKIIQDRVPGETNDCAVISVVAATGKSYAEVHTAFQKLGRKYRGSAQLYMIERVINDLGFCMYNVTYSVKARTMKRVGFELKSGTFLVGTPGHIACLRDGEVIDWTEGRCHRICEAYLIVRTCDPAPAMHDSYRLQFAIPAKCYEPATPAVKYFEGSATAFVWA